MKRQPIVIVGASLAGGTAAVTLRDEGFDGDIVLIGAESELPYNRPPLSKGYLRGQDRFSDQLVKPAAYYTEQRIELRLGVRATAIDPTQKLVELEGGERVAYDRLLVTTGGRNRTFSAPGAAPKGLSSTGDPRFNRLWTLMGAPCVNVAGLSDANNMPLGIQIVGRFGRDRAALEAALFVEQAIAKKTDG